MSGGWIEHWVDTFTVILWSEKRSSNLLFQDNNSELQGSTRNCPSLHRQLNGGVMEGTPCCLFPEADGLLGEIIPDLM